MKSIKERAVKCSERARLILEKTFAGGEIPSVTIESCRIAGLHAAVSCCYSARFFVREAVKDAEREWQTARLRKLIRHHQ